MFVWGETIGWSSVVNPLLRKKDSGFGIGDEESSWIGSTISIGGFIGGLMAGQILKALQLSTIKLRLDVLEPVIYGCLKKHFF